MISIRYVSCCLLFVILYCIFVDSKGGKLVIGVVVIVGFEYIQIQNLVILVGLILRRQELMQVKIYKMNIK